MPAIPIPGSLTNREIIDLAYSALGMSDSMFGRTAEEYATGLMHLRAMMGDWPYNMLGFDDAVATVQEESGIDRKYWTACGLGLAKLIALTTGKQLLPAFANQAGRSYSRLCADVSLPETVTLADGTPIGSGNRSSIDIFTGG